MKVFVFLFSPCLVFLQKLILPGFLLPFEGYHENLREISDPTVYRTFLGMVWGPSYEGFSVFVVPVFCFSLKTHTSWLSQPF
jgi:hypothetical protein